MSLISVADFQVLRDSPFRLGDGEARSQRLNWLRPDPFLLAPVPGDLALLSFNIRARDTADLTVEVIGAGPTTILKGAAFAEDFNRSFQEAFDLRQIVVESGALIGSQVGNLLFEFSVTRGLATISDVVVHYKIGLDG